MDVSWGRILAQICQKQQHQALEPSFGQLLLGLSSPLARYRNPLTRRQHNMQTIKMIEKMNG